MDINLERNTSDLAILYRKYIRTSDSLYRAVYKLQMRLSRHPYNKIIKLPKRPHTQPYLPQLTTVDRDTMNNLRQFFVDYETQDPLLQYVLTHIDESIDIFLSKFA
jgi:hypothetical protein